jgi:hypothetical protein
MSILLPAALSAQQPVVVGDGMRVRLTLGSGPNRVGEVLRASDDSVVIASRDRSVVRGFSRAEISKIEVSNGQHRRLLKGFALGLAAGLAIGAIIPVDAPDGNCETKDQRACELLGAVLKEPVNHALRGAAVISGGIVGGAVGLIVGSRQVDTWDTVPQKMSSGYRSTFAGVQLSF